MFLKLTLFCCLFNSVACLAAQEAIEIHQNENDLHVVLRPVDLDHLSEQDEQKLLELTGDYEVLKSMFGKGLGFISKSMYWMNPLPAVEAFKNVYRQQKAEMPIGEIIDRHYFIEDLSHNQQFMGRLAMATYLGKHRPNRYLDKRLITLSLFVDYHYRGRGLLSNLARASLQALANREPFLKADFCFSTLQNNIAINRIAQNLGAELTNSYPRELDCFFFKIAYPTNFYIITRDKILYEND